MANSVHIITKNGNFKAAVGDRKKAVEQLRKLAGDDLKVQNIGNLPEVEKPVGTIAIAGVAHWRIKVQPVE